MNPKIVRIDLTPLHVPFKEAVRRVMGEGEGGLGMAIAAEEPWLGADFVICSLQTADGTFGLSEVIVWLPETGVAPSQIIDVINQSLSKYILGESPFNVEKIRRRMDNNLSLNETAKGLLDMACYDLMGQITNLPACNFMGGRTVEEIPLAALIPLANIKIMVGVSKSYYRRGFKTFRLKLGRNIHEDREIIQSIRNALGNSIRLRVDYNQAYTPAEAVHAIKAIEPYGIDFAEQPVRIDDYIGMAYVQKRVNTPLMAHESFFSMRDFITLVELQAVGVLGLNSTRPGGITNAIKLLDYAEQRGIKAVIHDQPSGISSAMHIHLATARYHSLGHATELFGIEMLEDDLIEKPIDYGNGLAKLPDGPGWGVKLDEKALEKYATGPTITIEK